MLAGPQLLTGFSLADIADRHWGKLAEVLKRLKRAGLDAIAEAPVDRLHDARRRAAGLRRTPACRFAACRCRVRSPATADRAG